MSADDPKREPTGSTRSASSEPGDGRRARSSTSSASTSSASTSSVGAEADSSSGVGSDARRADARASQGSDPDASSRSPADRPIGRTSHGGARHHGGLAALVMGALGVVYGDIGTSPLYAFRECFSEDSHLRPTDGNVLGLLSLFFWSMTLVVTIKYIVFILRADNDGEGGILALLALALPKRHGARGRGSMGLLVVAGLFGASLLYGEGMLTPAISVLSAVEGLEGIDALQGHLQQGTIALISAVILVSLFAVQSRGTARVGAAFGPVMLIWFSVIGILGLAQIIGRPDVLIALSPHYAFRFFVANGVDGFWSLGSVVLCLTGAEALYADMGHFGRRPIWLSWSFLFPCLILNYFGQGAVLLEHPELHSDAFFALTGDSSVLRIGLVALATAATVIASQALISGAFSITRQAIQLGYLPRLEIRHTSSDAEGQIYIPEINWILMVAAVLLVLAFRSSSAMAAAYGIAVTGTMMIGSTLYFIVVRRWWGTLRAGLLFLVMFGIDAAFFSANLSKIESGGWIPLVVAAAILSLMTTWKLGRERVGAFLRDRSEPLDQFLDEVDAVDPVRVKGTAVFMTSSLWGTPPVLVHHFKHNQVLHEQIVLVSIVTDDVPYVGAKSRVVIEELREGFFRVTAHYGFMQAPKVTDVLKECDRRGLKTRPETTSFYLGREKLVVTRKPGMAMWRKYVFSFLTKNARPATDFFKLPPDRVVEMGMLLEL